MDSRRRNSRWTKRVTAWLAGALGPWLLRALGRTWRVRRHGLEHFAAQAPDGQRPVYVMWHENIPAGSVVHRRRELAVLISSHRDGEIIARSIQRMGYRTVRGSSSRGGARAMREMMRQVQPDWGLVLTPDGPRGPRYEPAPGAVYLAAALGRPLVATGFAARRAWRLRSWDRMCFPKPFTRLVASYAEPLWFDRRVLRDEQALGEAREQLRQALQRAGEDAARQLDGGAA